VFEVFFALFENEADDDGRNECEPDAEEESVADRIASLGALDEDPE
jgi:hypothetical protein